MNAVSDQVCEQVHALLARERTHLRDAQRAQREAVSALYYGDEDEAQEHLAHAQNETYAAEMCALEASDLLGIEEADRYIQNNLIPKESHP